MAQSDGNINCMTLVGLSRLQMTETQDPSDIDAWF